MSRHPFELPGSSLLRPWDLTPSRKYGPDPIDKSLVHGRGGSRGGAAARQTREDREQANPEALDIPKEPAPIEEKPKEPEARLSEGAWRFDGTRFHEEAEVSVKVELPPGKEHLTRIEAELHAKRPSGPELIARGEGHAQADGTAVITLPVYKPNGHQGEPIDYFLVFKHKLAKVFQPDALLRKISETALKSADHALVPGLSFPPSISFIAPKAAGALKALESRFKEWDAKHPKGKIVIYGHANPDEKDPKALSERRAQSAHAFITNDAEAWEILYKAEAWGLITLQTILADLGHYHDKADDKYGPATQAAFKAIQKKSGLPDSGREDAVTRKAIFAAYMKGKHDIRIDASRFRKVAGHPWMGCSHFNRVKDGGNPAPENRRAAFVLMDESKFFPVHFPCQDGSEAACQGQCKKAGKRSGAGIRCGFYDELVREEKQEEAQDDTAALNKKVLGRGDNGAIVEELNVRLSGFGGGPPTGFFDEKTEAKVRQFQSEWMKEKNPSGLFDHQTAAALDAFASEHPINMDAFKCKCGSCAGFGKGRYKGKYEGAQHSESRHKYEYPGMHRSLLWALRGIQYHTQSVGLKFRSVSSAYRCWEDNKNHKRNSTNHMGKALDLAFDDATGKKGGKSECDFVRKLLINKISGQIRWGSANKFSMEPSEPNHPHEYVATNWVHFDVREFHSRFLDDRFFCKTRAELEGKPMASLLGE